MNKWIISLAMLVGGCLNSAAQTITLPTKKQKTPVVTTTEKPEKSGKVSKGVESGIPVLPTTKKTETATEVPVTEQPKAGEVPQTVPVLPTTTTKPTTTEETAEKAPAEKIVVKRRQAPRGKTIKRHPKIDDNEIYESAEHIPTYPGGVSALMDFIQSNMQYPEQAKADNAEGMVQVSFVVEKDGTASDFEVVDEHHPALEAEAVRVMQMMPKWNPATQDGVKVRVEYTVPVKFTLSKDTTVATDSIN